MHLLKDIKLFSIQKSDFPTKNKDIILFLTIFMVAFIVLNFIDLAITLYGLSFKHVAELNELLYIDYFPFIKLVIVPVVITILLWDLLKINPILGYYCSIWINVIYTMIIINNVLIIRII